MKALILCLATLCLSAHMHGDPDIQVENAPILRSHRVPPEPHKAPDMTFPGAHCFVPNYAVLNSPSKAIVISKNTSVTINYGVYNSDSLREVSFKEDVGELGKASKIGPWLGWIARRTAREYNFETVSAFRQNEFLIVTGKWPTSSKSSGEKVKEVMRCVLLSLGPSKDLRK